MGTGRRGISGAIALACCIPLLTATQAGAAQDVVFQCGDDLCLVDPLSPSTPTNITQTTGSPSASATENYPSWSPDGATIAFKGIYSPNTIDVFTTDTVPGGTATNVSQTDGFTEADIPPQWSPGGERLAYETKPDSSANPLQYQVFVSPASGTAEPLAIASSNAAENAPVWSPDGTKVAFTRNGAIYTANADGSGTPQPVPNGATGIYPQWSPDGTRIAFIRFAGPNDYVRVIRVDGTGTPVDFTTPADSVDAPMWSPDSSRLVWTDESTGVRVAPANGSSQGWKIPVAAGVNVPRHPSFSGDGNHVVFHATYTPGGSFQQIFIAKADGSAEATPITSTATNNSNPDWKWTATGNNPPVDPPVVPTRPAATINLNRSFGGNGPYNPYRLSVSIDCNAQGGSGASNPLCQSDGIAKGVVPKRNPRLALGKRKPIVFAKGSKTIQGGETGKLKLKVTKAGKKVKPGTKFKLTVQVTVRSDGLETVTAKKTVKVKVPKR